MKLRILIADDEPAARFALRRAIACEEYEILEAEDGRAAADMIVQGRVDLAYLDLSMPVLDGRSILREAGERARSTEIIVVTADDTLSSAVACMQLGAADYISKPYEVEQVRAVARRAARRIALECRLVQLQADLDQQQACGALVGVSRPMRDLYFQMQRAARAPVDVLIRGETGTGKELIAREIHRLSPRAGGPFVAVNTSAIAESLAESELFGHVRGAFTGAICDRRGVFEQAHGGTLFLDEIGDMPLPAQTKILRALQERTVQPVGAMQPVVVDVRVITATHQNLEEAMAEKRFREDLYYRIKGVELQVPPLRQRREDILLLANYFLEQLAGARTPVPRLDASAADRLLAYAWPGNVRELKQVITTAASLAAEPLLGADDLPLRSAAPLPEAWGFEELLTLPLTEGKSLLVERFERCAIERALADQGGNVSAAARQLGIHRQSLQQKIAQLGLRTDAGDR